MLIFPLEKLCPFPASIRRVSYINLMFSRNNQITFRLSSFSQITISKLEILRVYAHAPCQSHHLMSDYKSYFSLNSGFLTGHAQ